MQFIQKATDRSWNVGHSLQSHTSEVKAIRVLFSDGISLVLVDTPGFDDTNKSDLDILKIIAKWFEDVYVHRCGLYCYWIQHLHSYRHDLEISGVLYLHRITDNRMGGTPQKNLKLFKKLCGARFFELVILMTTMWPENEEEDEEIFCNRELQLQKEYWADTIRNPEQIQRFRGTRASAWHILEELFSLASVCQHRKILEIQQELVDLSKRVPDTNAGRQLQGIIGELVVRQSDLMKRLQEELSKTSDPDILRALILELNDLLKQRNQAQKDLRQMGPTVIERVHQIEKLFSQWMDRLDNSLKTRARRLDEKLRKHASQLVQLASFRLGALYHGQYLSRSSIGYILLICIRTSLRVRKGPSTTFLWICSKYWQKDGCQGIK